MNSTAIGVGVVTTRDNQMLFGTATNTYTAAGIDSAASLAAQTGSTKLVTSDAGGNLATTNLTDIAAFQNVQTNVGTLQTNVGTLQSDVGTLQTDVAALGAGVGGAYAGLHKLSSDINSLRQDARENTEGAAMAIALGGAGSIVPEGKDFAASMNWGTFNGQNAMGFSGVGRVNENVFLNAGIGTGLNQGTVGGRAGVTFAW